MQEGSHVQDAVPVLALVNLLLHEMPPVLFSAVEVRYVTALLRFHLQHARGLAGVLARVHKHHRLMPLLQ